MGSEEFDMGRSDIFSIRRTAPASASIDAYGFYFIIIIKVLSITIHGSHRVDTWINHLKIQLFKIALCINMSSIRQTANRIGYRYHVLPSPNGCTQYQCPGVAPPAGDRTTYGSSG
jgi:hypothetical protein